MRKKYLYKLLAFCALLPAKTILCSIFCPKEYFYSPNAFRTTLNNPYNEIPIINIIATCATAPSLGCSINALISLACVPTHIDKSVRGNMPIKPAVRKFFSLAPEQENNKLLTAKGNTGESRANKIILNSSF